MIKNFLKLVIIISFILVVYLFKEVNKGYYIGDITEHFDGRRFHNKDYTGQFNLKDAILWQYYELKGEVSRRWPKFINDVIEFPVEQRVDRSRIKITFINHACFLIQTANLNILTDPIYSERVSPVNWIGPKRYRSQGISFDKLPKIDYVLISHDHYDHCDIDTLQKLQERDNPKIISGLGMKRFLADFDIRSEELDWWGTTNISNDIKVDFIPANHWSGRYGLFGNNRTLWGGFMIATPKGKIYFSGDTAWGGDGELFQEIKNRYKDIKISIIPIGAYTPRWFMKKSHIDPFEAVKIHLKLATEYSIAAHFGTFGLSYEGEGTPQRDLFLALEQNKVPKKRFLVLNNGQVKEF